MNFVNVFVSGYNECMLEYTCSEKVILSYMQRYAYEPLVTNNPPTCHDFARIFFSGYWGYSTDSANNIPFADIIIACVGTETGTAKAATQSPVTYTATGQF